MSKIGALAERHHTSPQVVLLACWQTLLWRLTGQEETVVHRLSAGREYEELRDAVGLVAKWLPIKGEFAPDLRFGEVIERLDRAAREADEWHNYFVPEHDAGANGRALGIGFEYNEQIAPQRGGGVKFAVTKQYGCSARFKISLRCVRAGEELQAALDYDPQVYERETIERTARHFARLLESAVTQPESLASGLEMLTAAERRQLLIEWNDTAARYPQQEGGCFHELFEAQVAERPDAPAVVYEHEQLTYGELNKRANQLAHHLKRLGVGPDTAVGLLVDRSVEMIIGLLGILKAGGAYVPLNGEHPRARLEHQLRDVGAAAVVTQEKLLNQVPEFGGAVLCLDRDRALLEREPDQNPEQTAGPENLVYVIYTSGSTGVPKGVGVTHRNLVNYTRFICERLRLDQTNGGLRFATVTTISADLGNTSIFPSLASGGCLHLVSYDVATDGQQMASYMQRHEVDVLKIVPSHLAALLGSAEATAGVEGARAVLPRKVLVVGGEALGWDLVKRIEGSGSRCRVFNHYGPTETTVGSLTFPLEEAAVAAVRAKAATVPVGRPIANTQVYVLDAHLQPVPVGVVGELYIGGAGVSRGYVNQLEQTRERFIEREFAEGAGGRLYKTGDLVRRLPDGSVEFIGRVDHQVKIRGFRVELAEIEAALSEHESVRECVVVATGDVGGEKRLAAYVVARRAVKPEELRSYLRERLPEYMVPGQVVELKALPLTRNGKVDRQALPSPEQMRAESERVFVAPRTQVEKVVADIWGEVLGAGQVSIEDNFFELGGHSLMITQVVSRIRATFQIELPLRSIFEAPTIARLAERIEVARQADEGLQAPPIERVPRDRDLPLSFAQQRLWFLDQLDPGSFLYIVPRAIRMKGVLNVEALGRTLDAIVARHEVLRATFAAADGNPVQIIAPHLSVTLPVTDFSALSESEREAGTRRLMDEEERRPFDLARGPLVRAHLLRLVPDEHILLLTLHHIVSDGWSTSVLFRELGALYEAFVTGKPSPLPELPIQYADYAVWQRAWLSGETLDKHLSYWRKQLGGSSLILELPTDRPRPAVQSYRGAHQAMALPHDLAQRLGALSQQEEATPFMTLLAVFKTLLMHYTKQEDIVMGSTIAGRNRAETEGLIGLFLNTLVLRTDLSGDPTFRELVGRVKEMALEAYAHQDVPFEKLVEVLQPERSLSQTPLSQVRFVLHNAPRESLELTGLALSTVEFNDETSKFDLGLLMEETEQGLVGDWMYKPDLFDAATITRLANHFKTLLEIVVAEPDTRLSALIAPLAEADKQQRVVEKGGRMESKFKKLMNVEPKAVSVSQEKLIKTDYLRPGEAPPLVIQPNINNLNLVTWAESNREFIQNELLKHGALLFRGFKLDAGSQFESFIKAISGQLLEYSYRSTPRTQVSGKIYTSTEYPADQFIPLHNEMSYSTNWPMKIWFLCVKSAERGGETPIADSRRVFERIDPKIREQFMRKEVMYVRNYTDGLDLSWQNVFQTTDKAEVEEFCRSAGIKFDWVDGNRLRTRQLCQAVARHPKTNAEVWFNQAHLFHVSSLEADMRESLLSSFKEEDLPRNVYYGDGSPIEDSVLDEIREAYRQETVIFPWQEGDTLLLDNMLFAHGRTPFIGTRKVLVGMAESVNSTPPQT